MDPVTIIFSIAILIFSVIAHELAHGYAAEAFGDHTARYAGRLTWNPIAHIDPVGSILVPIVTSFAGITFGWARPVPYDPNNLRGGAKAEAAVAGAGAFVNLSIALVFGLIIRFFAGSLPASFVEITSAIVVINIMLAVFNLIPIPPLDGSKVILAFFPLQARRLGHQLESWGLIAVLIFVYFFWYLFSPIIEVIFRFFTGLGF